jgi:predicted HD superfamily hydrolase involved in NAD metabolism
MPSAAQAREALRVRLSRDAFEHSERVAEQAAALARAYGADEEAAYVAGLLHDWDREIPEAELVTRAESAGMDVNDAERAVPYLLHAPVGAADLESEFPGADRAVLHAIASHTYGAPEMSPLDMVVYVADAIEPGRDWRGVEKLRAMVGRATLEDLFAQTYVHTVRHLVERRRVLHPATVATWNRFVARAPR